MCIKYTFQTTSGSAGKNPVIDQLVMLVLVGRRVRPIFICLLVVRNHSRQLLGSLKWRTRLTSMYANPSCSMFYSQYSMEMLPELSHSCLFFRKLWLAWIKTCKVPCGWHRLCAQPRLWATEEGELLSDVTQRVSLIHCPAPAPNPWPAATNGCKWAI